MLVETALTIALKSAQSHLERARDLKLQRQRDDVESCQEYLKAALAAITGLEEEHDEIISEAKWLADDDRDARRQLLKRIDLYINRDRLRLVLREAISGIEASREAFVMDADVFFRRRVGERRKATIAELDQTVRNLLAYMSSLGDGLDRLPGEIKTAQEYGPSGVGMLDLFEVQQMLEQERAEKERRQAISEVQRRRDKGPLLDRTAELGGLIRELMVVFR